MARRRVAQGAELAGCRGAPGVPRTASWGLTNRRSGAGRKGQVGKARAEWQHVSEHGMVQRPGLPDGLGHNHPAWQALLFTTKTSCSRSPPHRSNSHSRSTDSRGRASAASLNDRSGANRRDRQCLIDQLQQRRQNLRRSHSRRAQQLLHTWARQLQLGAVRQTQNAQTRVSDESLTNHSVFWSAISGSSLQARGTKKGGA